MKKREIASFEEAEAYLNETPRFTVKNTMEDTRAFLERLGSPDERLRIIHVAGTNGKGSVCAYLRSILEEAGYTTAVFTSPHLVDIRERFRIRGELVSREEFLRVFLEIYNQLDWEALEQGRGYHPTFFEYLFLMAMLLFAEAQPDYCILETGLGGRLDATNAVRRKELCVITRISLDHTEYLGHTVREIAGEKAGILCREAPAVLLKEVPEAFQVLEKRAEELEIPVYPVSKNDYAFLKNHNKNIDFSLHTGYYGCIRLTLHTIAGYQMENAALAVKAAEVLDCGRSLTAAQIVKGVEHCFWEGRMEEVLPEFFVDGAHNEDGIRAFLDTVRADGRQGRRSLLFSAVADKDFGHMLKQLGESGLFERIAAARMRTGRAAQLSKLKEELQEAFGDRYALYDSTEEAFRELLSKRAPGERIYAAGSLYLVGEIKELLEHD